MSALNTPPERNSSVTPRSDSFIAALRVPDEVVRDKPRWLLGTSILKSAGTDILTRTCVGSICDRARGDIDDRLKAVESGMDAQPTPRATDIASTKLARIRMTPPSG